MLDFNAIVAFCSSEQTLRGGLIGGLFLAGVAGSVMHCAPMCGGFVLGQVADRIARRSRPPGFASGGGSATPFWSRIISAA